MYDSNNFSYSNGSFAPNSNEPVGPEQKPPKKGGKALKAVAAVLAVAIIGGASGYGGAYLARSSSDISTEQTGSAEDDSTASKPAVTSPAANQDDGTAAAETLTNSSSSSKGILSTKEVVEKANPSVVYIISEFSSGKSSGTGIILSADGYIVTNAHVIEAEVQTMNQNPYNGNDPFSNFFGNFYNSYSTTVEKSSAITITDYNGKEYKATIVGSDSNTDLAVLKIDAADLTPAEIGKSSDLVMGDTAITLGYPLGLGLTASDGIIAGLDKKMTVEVSSGTVTMTLIQTDAAINAGNSGGPLLNNKGQVVGITSSKIVSTSVSNVGFAIPIDDALPILQELMTIGTVKNTVPKIGITGTPITAAIKRYYSLPVDSGVLVASVEAGSAAEKAGIAEGDVIIAADGENVTDMDSLITLKNNHKAGDTMTFTIARSDGNIDVQVVLDTDEDSTT